MRVSSALGMPAAAASRNGVARSRSHPLPPVNSGPSSSSSGPAASGQTTSLVTASTSASMSSVTNETGAVLYSLCLSSLLFVYYLVD